VSNAESINGYKEIRYADGGTYKGEWKPIVETKNQEVETLLNFKK
jgi:hypothetical protein